MTHPICKVLQTQTTFLTFTDPTWSKFAWRQVLVVSIVGTEKISFFQTHASKNEVSIDQTVKSMIASTFLSQTNLLCNIFVGHNEKCCREESGG